MSAMKGKFASERGAILIQAAVSSLVLLAFASFVIDYGVLWVSRNQAQNAADAGAAAGAIALAYEDDDPIQSAVQLARANLIWTQPGTPIAFFLPCPSNPAEQCVEVDVYRNGEFGSEELPTFFGPMLGIDSQGVRATATAKIAVGNATDCLRPLAIPDKWIEGSMPPDDNFLAYDEVTGLPAPNPDVYNPPTDTDPGSGFIFAADRGVEVTLTFPTPGPPPPPIAQGDFLPLDLTPLGNTYEQNIAACNGRLIGIGEQRSISTLATEALTTAGFTDLYDQDPGAVWDVARQNIQGSCAPECAPISPRLVSVAVYDVDSYQLMRATGDWSGCPGPGPCIRIVNILGFFITDVSGPGIVGYLTSYPGLISTASPTLHADSSFLKAIMLIR